jgi:DNA-binding SARP family transcriptional activator
MNNLRFFLLGTPRFLRGEKQSEVRLSRLLQSLLAYLLLHRQGHQSREVLAGVFWGELDDDHSRSCLTTAIWRLRKAFGFAEVRGEGAFISSGARGIGLEHYEPYWLDVDVFETQAARALRQPMEAAAPREIEELESVLTLYRGDLLDGFYEDWVLSERERLRLTYESCLSYLMLYYSSHGLWKASLSAGERLLQQDPLQEDVQQEVMRLYSRVGQRPRALRQYNVFRELLYKELGVQPAQDTESLHAELLWTETAASERATELRPDDVSRLLMRSKRLRRTLQSAADDLLTFIEDLENYAGRDRKTG